MSSEENPVIDIPSEKSKALLAEAIIRKNVLWAMGAGLIPVAGLDIAAISTAQVKMINELAVSYEVKDLTPERIRGLVIALIGGWSSTVLGRSLISSTLKIIPFVGTALGSASVPITAGATTYAIGKVFVMHFETGGTLLTFKPAKMKQYFEAEFKAGLLHVQSIKNEVLNPTSL
jgi:uncharacterized protein (DUF697 family)